MNKIKSKIILFMTVFCILGCNNQVDVSEEKQEEKDKEQQILETPMLKIEDNILTLTDKFTFEGMSNGSKIGVVIRNEKETWKYAKEYFYSSDFSFNIDNEIFSSVVKETKKLPVEEKVSIILLDVEKNWSYICHTDYNYKPNAERIAAFDYSKKSFTPKNMTFTEETAWEASEKMKNGANISNDLDCYVEGLRGFDLPPVIWESNWSVTPVTLENIRYLRSLGFNAIRLPVSWGQHLDSNNNIYASWINRVQEVVDWCMDEGLYVIINTHHDGGPKPGKDGVEGASWIHATEESYNANKDLYVKILSQICDRFKNYSEKLIFANVNEICPGDVIPGDQSESAIPDSSFRAMEKWNQIFVDTVRKSGGNNAKRNISVSSIATSYDKISLSRIRLPNDSAENHLLFEVHCYDPWNFCGHGDECTITEFAKSGFDINRALVPSFEFSQKYNIPVYIGEWGVFDYENKSIGLSKIIADEERAKYVEQFISYATKHGITPFLWLPCAYTGYTSDKDAEHYCPKFIKAIQDNIFDSEIEHKSRKIKLVPDYDWQASTKDENSFKGYIAVESFLLSDYNRTVNIGDILTFHIKGKVSTNIKTKDGKDNRYLTVQLISSDWNLLGDPRPLRFDENGNIDEIVKYKFFVNNYQINNPEKCKLLFNCDLEVVYNPEGFIELELEPITYENGQIERVTKIEATEEYTLTFEENFDGTDLNPAKWRRRAQLEHSNMKEPWNWADECSYVENGNLVIECRKNPVTGRYEAGGVETDGLFEQCGGKYEIRFKIDDGQGWWYAFWLMNMTEMNVNKSATDGCEIDILELIPHEKYIQTSFNWDGYPEDLSIKQAYYERWNFDENFFNDWHTATYYWMEDGYKLVMDGDEDSALVIHAEKAGGVNHSANFIFITAEYGDWYGSLWDKNPKIKDEMLPARMLVDYVKVWKGGNEPIEKKATTYTLKRDYKWDAEANAPSTTEYDLYGIRLDLTKNFEKLPVAGEKVSVNYKFVSDKNISDLRFYFVDTTSAANNYWLKLDGNYEMEGQIKNIKAGTEFILSYNPTLVTSPEGNIVLWIYYPKTFFDEEITLSVKK